MGQAAHHLAKVHRHRVGDTIEVVTAGHVFRAVISAIRVGEVSVRLTEKLVSPEATLAVTLYQGMPKGDKFELIIQKAVELGVGRVVPVVCDRSVAVLPHEKAAARLVRWQSIAAEAAKQSGRAVTPEISLPLSFSAAVAESAASLRLMAYEGGGRKLKDALRQAQVSEGVGSVDCVVGPEGGLTAEEVNAAVGCGFIPVTLGPRILRTETAALALLCILMYELGDMGD